jgi:hypothetical protein
MATRLRWEESTVFFRYLFIFSSLCLLLVGGCVGDDGSDVPADFSVIVDAESAGEPGQHINIRINATGDGRYDLYDTGGAIRGDANGLVTYEASQVVESGEFHVNEGARKRLWDAIEDNHFFGLTEDYRMAIGHSYGFIVVEANDRRHQVFNIGMKVPEIQAIIEATERVLPEGLDLEYREGYLP